MKNKIPKVKYTYSIESNYNGNWTKLLSETKDFCIGYISHAKYCSPRNAMRVIRNDGKIVIAHDPLAEVSIGMIASWPTAEQYDYAAKTATEMAARIREQSLKQIAALHVIKIL